MNITNYIKMIAESINEKGGNDAKFSLDTNLCEDEETKLFQNESERYVLTMNKVIEALDKILKEGKIDESKLRNYKFVVECSYDVLDQDGGLIENPFMYPDEVDFDGDLKEFNSYLGRKSIVELLNAIKEKNKLDCEIEVDYKYQPDFDSNGFQGDWDIDIDDDTKKISLQIYCGEVDYSETR